MIGAPLGPHHWGSLECFPRPIMVIGEVGLRTVSIARDIDALESVQRHCTKHMPGLKYRHIVSDLNV